jgi:hypothetical protein
MKRKLNLRFHGHEGDKKKVPVSYVTMTDHGVQLSNVLLLLYGRILGFSFNFNRCSMGLETDGERTQLCDLVTSELMVALKTSYKYKPSSRSTTLR